MSTFNDIMVDIETTGTDPVHNAMLQLAAVKFNYTTGEIGPVFCHSMRIPGHRFWDLECRVDFWGKHEGVLADILTRAEDPAAVMHAYADFCTPVLPTEAPRFWSKPTHFDWTFVQMYARDYGVLLPTHYRDAVDLNSFIRGLAGNPGEEPFGYDIPFVGDQHNALDDCFHQLRILFSAKEHFKNAAI